MCSLTQPVRAGRYRSTAALLEFSEELDHHVETFTTMEQLGHLVFNKILGDTPRLTEEGPDFF